MTDTTDIKVLRERMMQQREAALTGCAPSFEECELLVCDLLRALTLSNKQLEAERQRADANAQEIRKLELQWEHRAPTQWAYDQACTALHAQRERAEKSEAELAALKGDQVPVAELQTEIKALMRTYALVSSPSTMATAHDAGYAFVKAKGFNRILSALFTAPQMPVVLPDGYKPYLVRSQTTRAGMTTGGDWLRRDKVIAAIESAGGIVEDGE